MTAKFMNGLQQTIHTCQLANRMTIVGEPNASFQSAAMTLLIPCGYAVDPADRLGLTSVLCDMVLRGAGTRDNRQLINDLEILGVERGESVGASQTSFSAATLADNLNEALAIYADIVRRPHLPEGMLEAAQQVCLQEIYAVDDEPSQRLIVELRRRSYPEPWGRSNHGEAEGIQAITPEQVRQHWSAYYRPNGAILGVAGDFVWEELVAEVERLFGDWPSGDLPVIVESPAPTDGVHIAHEANQCHVGIAYPSVPYRHPDYLRAWAAVGVLSGGMSSRLFTEVREKRGLCYTVSASLQTQLDRARVLCYAGTSVERAQETLDVTYAELLRLREGVLAEELSRLKARIKSSLIMQQESTSSRSGAIAREWYHLGRVRTLDEIGEEINALSAEMINEYLAAHPPQDFTFATLGPAALELPREVS